MTIVQIPQQIKSRAKELGFAYCGFARCTSLPEWEAFYNDYIRNGGHAGFRYLETNLAKRMDPTIVLPGAGTVVAVLQNYFPGELIPEDNNFVISKYAYHRDPYPDIRKKLRDIAGFIAELFPGAESRIFVDSGPVLEKIWAQRCGVGWQGKNSLIINKESGSFFFIGILLTTAEIAPDEPETDHCGSCNRCVEACPTHALENPYQLKIRNCISYYTIEKKEEIPPELANRFHDRIFGCDICQDVCPYNRFSAFDPGFSNVASEELKKMRKPDWMALTPDRFIRLFQESPVERTGYEHFMKMIRLNSGDYSPQ